MNKSTESAFERQFQALLGFAPFPWQTELYRRFVQLDYPDACVVPTGVGKTAAIAVWLLALAHHALAGTAASFPRRMVYVVNRRTVVDQATDEVRRIRAALVEPASAEVTAALREITATRLGLPFALSTLRGELADNAEWRVDPTRPSIIAGTVDMIGSRLLFCGYGLGFRTRPLHAGFLGQDTLILHDEAHLEPAFQELLLAIEREQQRCRDIRPIRTIALTATPRGGTKLLRLTEADHTHPEVTRRVKAIKRLGIEEVADEQAVIEKVLERVAAHRDSGQAILIYLRKVEDVERVAARLGPAALTLTGTMRGWERDRLVEHPIFRRFSRYPDAAAGNVYLVATSAGEVGVNISADHMVSDLTPLDSMTQRFGRVNRFGDGAARIDVIYAPGDKHAPVALEERRARTLEALRALPLLPEGGADASPAALASIADDRRTAAYSPEPAIRPLSEFVLDSWSLTSIRDEWKARPPVSDWLHGIEPWEPPETVVAWREEVGEITGGLLEQHPPEELLEEFPLKPHELLRDRTKRVREHLRKIAQRKADLRVWVWRMSGEVTPVTLGQLAGDNAGVDLDWCTVLLPPAAGGLLHGRLDGAAEFDGAVQYDVSDQWQGPGVARRRTWDGEVAPPGMRLVRTIDWSLVDPDPRPEDEPAGVPRVWHWWVAPRMADTESATARKPQLLHEHLELAGGYADAIAARSGLPPAVQQAIRLAARWHDLGKNRVLWQRSIGNPDPQRVLAKSGPGMRQVRLTNYRHELGSVLDTQTQALDASLPDEVRDLLLHCVAAHHGRARPHFPAAETLDPHHADAVTMQCAAEAALRFGHLQQQYGRWGLAYIESLLRAVDALASQPDTDFGVRIAVPGPGTA